MSFFKVNAGIFFLQTLLSYYSEFFYEDIEEMGYYLRRERNKNFTREHVKLDGEKPMKLQPTERTIGKMELGNLSGGFSLGR